MSILRKREGDNEEILEVEEILKNRGFSISLAADPDELQLKGYIKRLYISASLTASREKIFTNYYGLNKFPMPQHTSMPKNRPGRKDGDQGDNTILNRRGSFGVS